MKIENGSKILVQVTVLGRARDDKPEAEKGYVIQTSRGSQAYIEPDDIFFPLKEMKK